jgi:hypothetical protein
MSADTTTEKKPSFKEIMEKSAKSALQGGAAGALAMGANVAALMWIRTTVSLICYFFGLIYEE